MRNEELLEKEKNIAWDYTNSACRKKKQEGSGRQAVSVRRIPGMFSFLSLVILISFHVIAYFLRVLDWRVQDDCSKETRETSNLSWCTLVINPMYLSGKAIACMRITRD